jgi:trimeric autotransporter adhesin
MAHARSFPLPRPVLPALVRRSLWALALTWTLPGVAAGQVVRDHVWVTDDNVLTTTQANNLVYLGGSFTKVGPATGSMVAVDVGTAEVLKPYPQVLGTVLAVVPDASGGVFLGGSFTHVAGQPRLNLAHLDANGNLTSWNPGLGASNSTIRALAVSGTTVYLGGFFSSVGGQSRANLAAVDATTGVPTSWTPNPNGQIHSLAVQGMTLYAGGFFSNIAATGRTNLAAFDITSGTLTGFSTNLNGGVYCILTTSTTVYVGGNFNTVNFSSRVAAVALDPATGFAFAWNPNFLTGNVYTMAGAFTPTGAMIYLGGDFHTVGGQPRSGLAAVDAGTGGLSSFNPAPNGTVRCLSASVGPISLSTLYVGGDFNSIGGQSRGGLAALEGSGVATSWDPKASSSTYALGRAGSKIYVGGVFSSMGWVDRNGIAAFDATTGTVTDWNPNAVGWPSNRGNVFSILVSGYTVYVGGYFQAIGGQFRNNIAALDVATGTATAWNPNAGTEGTIYTMALANGLMYLGGSFNTMGGQPRSNLAAVDAVSGGLSSFNPNVTGGAVQVIRVLTNFTLNPPKVYFCGYFSAVGGVARNGLAQVNGDTGGLASWNPNPNSQVASLLVFGNGLGNPTRFYVGGYFTSIGGQLRNRIAELDAAGVPTAWNPDANFPVHSLSYAGSILYVGGSFWTIGGQPRKGLAAIDAVSGAPTGWTAETNGNSNSARGGTVYSILQIGSSIWASGNFDGALNLPHANIAAYSADGAVTGVEPETSVSPANARVHASPNPFRTESTVRFALDQAGSARVAIYDAAGRLVRRLHDGVLPAGERRMVWDGRSDSGHPVASALYFVKVETSAETRTSKVFRLR